MSKLGSMWGKIMGSKQRTEVRAETGRAGALTVESEAPQGCAGAAPAPQRGWAAQGRKSIRTEEALQKKLARCNALKRQAEDTLAGLAEEKKRALKLVEAGEGWADTLLRDTLRKIDDEERKLEAFKEVAEKAQSNLDDFRSWMAAYAPERLRIQNALSDLAGARLEIDCELERLLREALAMLQVREETIAFMRQQARAIDLTCSFEAGVPASLHEALSLEIVSASKAWNAQFLGEEKHLKRYVVSAESFEPAIETLTRKAVYSFGETVYLLEEEATEFLQNDRPRPNGRAWETLPPTLMTAEAFAAVQAESGRTGPILKYVLEQKHSELEQKRREAYLLESRGSPVPGAHLHFVL